MAHSAHGQPALFGLAMSYLADPVDQHRLGAACIELRAAFDIAAASGIAGAQRGGAWRLPTRRAPSTGS